MAARKATLSNKPDTNKECKFHIKYKIIDNFRPESIKAIQFFYNMHKNMEIIHVYK